VRWASLLFAALILSACGGHKAQTPEQVARSWSAALNRSDNRAAGALFAPNARVIQSGVLVLPGEKAAAGWNAELPCGGKILSVQQQGPQEVLVVFLLTERPGHICDGPGQRAAAVFDVQDGRITAWHQVPPPTPGQSV
jgi:limonene-1,2-epoxide hydrolase